MKKSLVLLAVAIAPAAILSAFEVTLLETNVVNTASYITKWRYGLSDNLTKPRTAVLLEVDGAIGNVTMPNIVSIDGIPWTVTNIAAFAVADNPGLLTFEVPNTVLEIGAYAFANCTALSEVKLDYGIRYIGERAFINTDITEIKIPDSLLDMGGNISAGTLFTSTINISDSSHFTYSDDGVLYNKDMTKLYSCPTRAEGTITIPSTVTNICADAFFGCFRLSYLNIPENINTIGNDAFNVYGIWPDLIWREHPPSESNPKLLSVFYNGKVPNAADDIYAHTPTNLVTYAFTEEWPNTWKDRPVIVISEANPPILSFRDNDGITWYYRITNGEAKICNEDANGNAIAAISPISTSGTRYYESEESLTYILALKIPNSINGFAVTKIGDHAFDGCKAVTTIGLSPSVQEIGDYAFNGCSALRAICRNENIPWGVEEGKITLPTGITKVGYHAFEGLKASYISFPYTVSDMNGNPLAGMDYVTTVEVDASNPKFYSSGNIIYNKSRSAVIGVPANYDGSSISFLTTVTTIGSEALYGCENLETITLPDTLKMISANAFEECTKITSLTIPETVTKIGTTAFSNCTSLVKVTYEGNAPTAPDTLYAGTPTDLTSYAGKDKGFSETTWKDRPIVIQDSGTVPGDDELSCTDGGLTWYFRVVDGVAEIWHKDSQCAVISDEPILNLALPQTLGGYIVKGIGDGALSDLRGITAITVPNTYEWIGDYAFSNCTSLASVTLGNGIEKIGHWPFYGTKLTSLAIPDSVSEIDGNPVAGCAMMTAVSVADSQPYFAVDADGLLFNKKQETLIACPATKASVTLPDTLKTINNDAFYGCNLMDNMCTIYDGAIWTFEVQDGKATITEVSGASGDVTIPEFLGVYPVEKIKDGAFMGCTNITSFASESAAFSTRKGILYSADGTALICVPDTLTLPYVVTTSNTTITIVTYVEAGASGNLPYAKRTETTNAPITQVSTESVPGDISFEELLSGVTEIRGYAFNGVNAFEPSITTNGLPSGIAIPAEGKAYAYITNSITIISITHSTQIPATAKTISIADTAFTSSGLIYNPGKAPPTAILRTIATANEPLPGTASVYFGYLYNPNDTPCGTIQVKIAKARNGIAKVTSTIQISGAKKKTLKGSLDVSSGNVSGIDLSISQNSLSGNYNGYRIEGARDLFSSKQKEDKAEATKALNSCPKVINIVWPDGMLAVKISSSGKSKVSGTLATGSNVSATSQLIIGEDWLCVPVLLSKTSTFFLIWISRTDGSIEVEGLENAVAGPAKNLRGGTAFQIDAEEIANLVALSISKRNPEAVEVLKDKIPNGIAITQHANTWTASKHESALKLRYTESTRSFKGTFKVFSIMNGRQKSTAVTVSGVMIGDVGYGFATVKKAGTTPIAIR